MRSRIGAWVGLLVWGVARPAGAAEPPPEPVATPDTTPAPEPARKPLAAAAWVFPGVVAHGSAHWAAGEKRTAYRLLAAEGVGVGLIATGITSLALTGASRRLVGLLAGVSGVGAGLFVASWFADLYGVLAPPGGTGASRVALPLVETRLGLLAVYDPQFAYSTFVTPGVDLRKGRLGLALRGAYALDDRNARQRALGTYRFVGPLAEAPRSARDHEVRDGSFVEAEAGVTRHTFGREHFAFTTYELALAGRYDLSHVGSTLAGSFAEGALGSALQVYDFAGVGSEAAGLLLMRLGFGAYLGRRGEAALYYDHRHDDFAAGMKLPGLGSGVGGHVGLRARYDFASHVGVEGLAEAGSAYLVGTSLVYRYGGESW